MKDDMDSTTWGGSQSSYSEDFEPPSERTLSPCSRTPSPGPRRGLPASSPVHKQGVRQVPSRPQREGLQKQGGPKNLDLVHNHVLFARRLYMNDQSNAMAELQLRTNQLQKENRLLRQLLLRQEKSLQLYEGTDSKLEQLLTHHSGETQALREQLRRAQARGCEAERSLKETREQLHRSQATVGRLRRQAEQQELPPREELRRQLEQEKANTLEIQSKIKDLERSIELNSSSYQRQLAAERKKILSSHEVVRVLQDELERLSNKLKEKDRELDTMNIYANRMLKPSARKDPDSMRKKAPSRTSTKEVQTEDRKLRFGVPTPPPLNTPCTEYSQESPDDDDFFSLKDLERSIQLGSLSYQRQLEEERKKTLSSQEEVRVLEDELERLSNKLKELDKPDRRPQVTEEEKKKEEGDQQRKRHQENGEELKSDRKEHVLEEKRRRLRDGRRLTEPGEVGGPHGDESKETEGGVLAGVGRRGVRAQPTRNKDFVFGS